MNDIEYKEAFGIDPFEKKRVEKALDYALDIRKFEIDLTGSAQPTFGRL